MFYLRSYYLGYPFREIEYDALAVVAYLVTMRQFNIVESAFATLFAEFVELIFILRSAAI